MRFRLMLQMIAPTLLVSVALLLLGSFAAWYVHQLQRDSSSEVKAKVGKAMTVEQLTIIGHDVQSKLREFATDKAGEHLQQADQHLQQVEKLVGDAFDALGQLKSIPTTKKEQDLLEEVRDGYAEVRKRLEALRRDQQVATSDEIVSVVETRIRYPLRKYRELIGDEVDEAAKRNEEIADRMGLGLLVLGACGAVAGLVAGFGFARGLHRSIVQLTVPVHDAAGRLNEVVGPFDVAAAQGLVGLESTMQSIADHVGTVVERLQESERAARRTEQLASLGQLAAGIAHELRNPLTSLKIIVEAAADEGGASALDDRDLEVLREEIIRMERTIQSFLDYARPPKLVKRTVAVRYAIEQAANLVGHRAEQIGINIVREIPEDVVDLEADAAQLRQVLLNLMINAIDASPENGTVTVRLSVEKPPEAEAGTSPAAEGDADWTGASKDSVSLRIDVEDEGPGIPDVGAERIFEPFVTTKESGTGLGLPICRRIVEDHGGTITAANRPQGGAVFTVRLPVTRRQAAHTAVE